MEDDGVIVSAVSDVVDDNDVFRVSPKIQIKMQSRHNLMLNIQNISKIIRDIENGINRYCTVLTSMDLHSDAPHYWLLGEYSIPITDKQAAKDMINAQVEQFSRDLDKHVEQVKSMQVQHDGLTKEIDLMMEVEKGKYEAGKQAKEKMKRRRNR